MNIGPNITIINNKEFWFKGHHIEGVRSLQINLSKNDSMWYIEVFTDEKLELCWDFAKEMHHYGFGVNLHCKGDWFEWYHDHEGQSHFEPALLTKKESTILMRCPVCNNMTSNEAPFCPHYHN